jgi:hypothetical protein
MPLNRRPRKYEEPVRVQFIWEKDKLELLKTIARLRSTDVATLIQQALDTTYILPFYANNISTKGFNKWLNVGQHDSVAKEGKEGAGS